MPRHHRAAAAPRRRTSLILLAAVAGVVLPIAGLAAVSQATASQPSTASNANVDLADWYLTLPTGKKGSPDTVHAPELARYSSTWFHPDDATGALVLTANAGGATTKGSAYPRSELREMNGKKMASWSNTSGTHTLEVRQAVTALPKAKPEVVTAQVHDASSDVLEVRLEGTKLIAQYNDGKTDVTLDPRYTLGTVYDVKIVAASGRIQVFYNGAKKVDIARKGSGWYFKSGCYVQSNTSRGDKASAVGTVELYRLDVTHSS
jgi:predicted nucleic acid-binding Zn ribbon protein